MDAILDFLKNLGNYFISINANAYYSIMYVLSKNWLIIFSTISIGILMYTEIRNKNADIIHDKRDII